jgi:hypothetical protein
MEKVYEDIANSYPNNILKEFNYSESATSALSLINQELTDIYNFIEPAFFGKKIVLVKNLNDDFILPEEVGENLKIN